jgi:DNA primase
MRCGESTSLYNYLKAIDRSDLIDKFSVSEKDEILSFFPEEEIDVEEVEQKEINPPVGFKRLYFDDYLNSRGFTPEQYNLFKVGTSDDMRFVDHVVFLIYNNNRLVSWLARSRRSKEWHKDNLKAFKERHARLVLRYYNSEGTEFSNILGGYDEIVEGQTDTVILVEGITDKANVDRKMNLYSKPDTKCNFTFGHNFSENQVKLLKKKGVKNIVLMYDPDALKEIEKFGLNYWHHFKSVQCARLRDGVDPGEETDLINIMNNLCPPLEFYHNNIKQIQ